jgi:hypothetical protein
MTEEKQKSTIKTIGFIIIALSCFIAFSNGMGALMFSMMNFTGTNTYTQEPAIIGLLWENYLQMCFGMILLSVINIISGIGLIKFKNWSRIILIINSILISSIVILISILLLIAVAENHILSFPNILIPCLTTTIFFKSLYSTNSLLDKRICKKQLCLTRPIK